MLDKRKAELGVTYERKPIVELAGPGAPGGSQSQLSSSSPLIFDDGAVEQDAYRLKTLKSSIDLVDLEQEEQRDVEAIRMCMKKYHKLWKNLFSKYANTGFSTKHATNFD